MLSIEEGFVEIIYDLIRINNDRVDYYENIMIENKVLNTELIEIFRNKVNESRRNAEELTGLTVSLGIDFPGSTVAEGKIFRVWSEAKKMFNGKDRKALINDCEHGEEAALEAYKAALISDSLNDYDSRELIMDQKYALQIAQDMLKKYRDLQELVLLTGQDTLLIWDQNLQNIKAG